MKRYIVMLLAVLLLQYACDNADNQKGQGNGNGNNNQVNTTGLDTFETTLFAGSGVCAFCHSDLQDSQGNDVSIDEHWRTSMMANASRDPLWIAKVESEIDRTPGLKSVIEDKCQTCHMPMARVQALSQGSSTELFGTGFLDEAHSLNSAAMDGVSCTLCHQIKPDNLGSEESFSGGFEIDETLQKPNRIIYGPYSNLNAQNMINRTGFRPEFGEHVEDSAICATCHTLFTPVVDHQGNLTGTHLPEQTPYLEWQKSDYASKDNTGKTVASCQSCHMPAADGSVAISNRPRNGLPQREGFRKHLFLGGNFLIPQILRDNLSALGVTATVGMLDVHLNRIISYLENNTASLEIISAERSNSNLEIVLRVINRTGHKLPTGIPIRRVWLNVKVTDSANNVIFHSGGYDNDGRITVFDDSGTLWKRHRDVIDNDAQVQVYETVMVNTDGEVTYTLLRGERYIKDNRLLPSGFDKAGASWEIATLGDAADDDNFKGGSDTVRYLVNIDGSSGPYKLEARLEYQTATYHFIQDLLKDKDRLEYVREFSNYYENTNQLIQTLAFTTSLIE